MESLYIRSMPKMLQKERKIERKRDIKRERERGGDIYTCFCCPWKNHIDISIYQSERQIDSSIHRSTHQSINPPTIQNHELPHPHSNSSLHNSRVMRCTHPNSSSSSSSSSTSSSSPHTHHQHQSQKKTADYPSLTPKPIFSTTGMHGRHRRSRSWKWNLLPRNCRKWNRSDL